MRVLGFQGVHRRFVLVVLMGQGCAHVRDFHIEMTVITLQMQCLVVLTWLSCKGFASFLTTLDLLLVDFDGLCAGRGLLGLRGCLLALLDRLLTALRLLGWGQFFPWWRGWDLIIQSKMGAKGLGRATIFKWWSQLTALGGILLKLYLSSVALLSHSHIRGVILPDQRKASLIDWVLLDVASGLVFVKSVSRLAQDLIAKSLVRLSTYIERWLRVVKKHLVWGNCDILLVHWDTLVCKALVLLMNESVVDAWYVLVSCSWLSQADTLCSRCFPCWRSLNSMDNLKLLFCELIELEKILMNLLSLLYLLLLLVGFLVIHLSLLVFHKFSDFLFLDDYAAICRSTSIDSSILYVGLN